MIASLRGVFFGLLFAINIVCLPLLIVIVGCIAVVIRFDFWQRWTKAWIRWCCYGFTVLSTKIVHACVGEWHEEGRGELNSKHWYLLIANHQSYMDIPIINAAFLRKAPLLRFFIKKELLWSLPVLGLASKFADYPFMGRYSAKDIRKNPALRHKDLDTAKEACQLFASTPCTIMSFLEGTRYSEEKAERQNSPYNHLLKPKTGSIAVIVNELTDTLSGVISACVYYQPQQFSLWDFFCGRVKRMHIRYQVLPISDELLGDFQNDREYRKRLQAWVNQQWQDNDAWLSQQSETEKST